jgi:hypothetical protein
MFSRLATCVVLLVGYALLAIPAQHPVQGNQDQLRVSAFGPGQTNYTIQQIAFRGFASSAKRCNPLGYPCDFHGYPCCPGLSCVYYGGSTRAGYQCRPGPESVSTGLSRRELGANELDRDALAEFSR